MSQHFHRLEVKEVKEETPEAFTIKLIVPDELKDYYKQILNNGEMSLKGGGGLGMIDIARKTGQKLGYNFEQIDEKVSFFSLNIRVSQV